jgi:hypothetical protein
MSNVRTLRATAIAAGLLSLVAFAPSAFAQTYGPYWNGATPTAPGPSSPYTGPMGPGAPGWSGYNSPAASGSYWIGAPNATGPS